MSYSDHQMIKHQIFRMQFTELNEIYLVMGLRAFVTAMIGIFIPIYLYTLGYGLRYILLLQLAEFTMEFLFEYPSAKLLAKFGPKRMIAVSMGFMITYFFLIRTITIYHWPITLLALTSGVCMALYWQAYHFDFSRSKGKSSATKDVSKLYMILAVLSAIAPFIGGTIATNFGINILFAISLVLLFLIFIPMIRQGEKHKSRDFNSDKIEFKKIGKDMISNAGSGVEASAGGIIWPLFVFLIVGSYEKVGLVTSLALIVTLFVTYIVGKRVNNTNRRKYIQTSSLLSSAVYVIQAFVESITQVFFVNIARSLISSVHSAPYISEYYLHADERSRSEYIFAMESSTDVLKIVMFVVLYLLTFALETKVVLICGFFIGAAGTLLMTMMPPANCEKPFLCVDNRKIKFIPRLRPKHETN